MANEAAITGSKVDINEIKENYTFIVRDFSKGISIDEIEKIRQNFVNKVKSKYPEKVAAFAVPDIPEGAKIVAYGIKIDRNGVINQYFGFAGDKSDGIITQSELVEKTGLSKASVSRALDLLESKGLVERRRRGMGNVVLLK